MSSAVSDYYHLISSNRMAMMVICVAGIVGSLLVYGVLQERLMTQPFGDADNGTGEKFKFSVFIVLHNRMISALVAIFAIIIRKSSFKPVAPAYAYLGVSASNVVATSCQYEALKYVSFPMQTLAKCSKMIPVMIWGMIIMRKKYALKDYLIAVGITIGATIFVLYGDITSGSAKKARDTTIMGMLLMLGYLGFDGFTSTFQDKLFKGYQMETYNQMLYVNLFSSGVSVFTLVSTGTLIPAIQFVFKYPDCWNYIILLSLASTVGQLFILYTIKEYGALIFATIMTTRQFLSILLSCVLFAHPLTAGQWMGTTLIFGSLYYKSLTGSKKGSSHSNGESTKASDQKDTLPLSVTDNIVKKHSGLLSGEYKEKIPTSQEK